MKLFLSGNHIVPAICWILIAMMAALPACRAQSATTRAQPATTLDKHARKIYKKLSHYPAGAYLHLAMSDGSDQYGKLASLSQTSFNFTDSEANKTGTYRYGDVNKASQGKEYIDEETGSGIHIRHLIPIAIVAAAAGTAAAVVLNRYE